MDLSQLSGNERLIAEQAVLAYRAAVQAAQTAPHGQGMAVMEQVVSEKGLETVRRMLELSASEHPEAQKKGPAASRVPAATR
jgi:hypothetical protein